MRTARRLIMVGTALALTAGCGAQEPGTSTSTAGLAAEAPGQTTTLPAVSLTPDLNLDLPAVASDAYVPGQVLVRFVDAADLETANARLGSLGSEHFRAVKVLFRQLDVYLVELADGLAVPQALAELEANPQVLYAQADHLLSRRASFPDDTQFDQQWHHHNTGQSVTAGSCSGKCGGQASDCYCDSLCQSYGDCCDDACNACGYCGGGGGPKVDADIDSPEAWDAGTGLTLAYPPVVAIMESGCDTDHSDLAANMWVNPGELPGNNFDDDQNGYKDDVHGWNVGGNNGSIPQYDSHGTAVAGVIGARGDNNHGVAGVDWGARIMVVSSSSTATSATVASYQYAADLKQQWLQTGGAKGANVVATNSSFGYDNANCNSGSYPLWNDMYNEMGALGILSAASTTNNNVNVDTSGDVPTGCSSPWLVAVTSTDQSDSRAGTGYGAVHVDLGAPGAKIRTTSSSNSYATESGTSFASPMVAGAVALMHSQAPDAFYSWYVADPAAAALALKQLLLDGTDPLATLQGKTVSGGRLNLYKSGLLMADFCAPQCSNKECGDDGCGGVCGTCHTGEVCDADGLCAVGGCTPSCLGKECGDDGCGGSCGACPPSELCVEGECMGTGSALGDTFDGNEWMATARILWTQPVGTSYVRIRAKVLKAYKGCSIEAGKNVSLVVLASTGCLPQVAVGETWIMAASPYGTVGYTQLVDSCGYLVQQSAAPYDDRIWLNEQAATLDCP